VVCHYCQKKGHFKADCYSKKRAEGAGAPQYRNEAKCYSCGEVGHRKFECQKRIQPTMGPQVGLTSVEIRALSDSIEAIDIGCIAQRPHVLNANSETGLCTINGSLNGHQETVVVDTGASVSLVESKHVKPAEIRKCSLKRVTGVSGADSPVWVKLKFSWTWRN